MEIKRRFPNVSVKTNLICIMTKMNKIPLKFILFFMWLCCTKQEIMKNGRKAKKHIFSAS
jgi:hypothetical protein